VIVPLDGSALAEASLPIAALWAEAFGVQVVLLTCVRELIYGDTEFVPASYWLPLPPGEGAVDARTYLDGIAQRVRFSRVEAVAQVVSGFDAARAVRDAAGPDDIIVMATHGHGGLRRALLGSVADEVIREAAGAVLVIRPAAPVEQSDEEIEATRRDLTMSSTSGA
jgi:nucleotide-binding universal stress UspA family protein